jgi:hypothetical protein
VSLTLLALVLTTGLLALSSEGAAEAGLREAVRKAYDQARSQGLSFERAYPVSHDEMGLVVWRFQGHRPAHWPFSGALPSTPEAETPDSLDGPRQTKDELSQLGAVVLVAYDPDVGAAIGFRFTDAGQVLAFEPGDAIRASEEEPARFRLRAIKRVDTRIYHVLYDVLANGKAIATRTYVHDGSGAPLSDTEGPIRPAGPADSRRAAPGKLEVLRPLIHIRKNNRWDRVIEVDRETHGYIQKRGRGGLTQLVKTAVAKDKRTGRVLGLRIVGMDNALKGGALGIERGDILVSIDDQKIASRADAVRIAQGLDPDSEQLVKLVIERRGRLLTLRVDARDPRTKREIRYFTWP